MKNMTLTVQDLTIGKSISGVLDSRNILRKNSSASLNLSPLSTSHVDLFEPLDKGLAFTFPYSPLPDAPIQEWDFFFDQFGRNMSHVKDFRLIREMLCKQNGLPMKLRGDCW